MQLGICSSKYFEEGNIWAIKEHSTWLWDHISHFFVNYNRGESSFRKGPYNTLLEGQQMKLFECTSLTAGSTARLKEKLPQAFMQIRWMERDFRNITANVWANLDNPIKSYDFSKFLLISCIECRPLMWPCVNICDVTTVQLSHGTVHKFN